MNAGTEGFETPFNSEAGFILGSLKKDRTKKSEPQLSRESTESSNSPRRTNSSSVAQSKSIKKSNIKMDPMEFEQQ
jgi:hypothetical protein